MRGAVCCHSRSSPVGAKGLWQAGLQTARHVGGDEFGIDRIHVLERSNTIRAIQLGRDQFAAHSFVLPADALRSPHMVPVQLWSVPFQDAVVVLLQSREQRHFEVLWMRSNENEALNRDLSLWAVNHNNLLDDPREFRAPGYLRGDPTLAPPPLLLLLFTATEGRTDIVDAKTATASIVLRQRDVLVFDQLKQSAIDTGLPKQWRQLLSDEVWEMHADVVATCYVLDAFLLYACDDGVLRAHPRNNPHSVYHVEDMQSLVYQMTSLYNIAIIHSVDVPCVR